MQAYACGALGKQEIPFSSTDRIIAIGSDRMMNARLRFNKTPPGDVR